MVCLWLEFGQQYRTHFVTGLCISEPIFYGDLVYKFKRIVRKSNFSDQFKKIVKRYVRVGYYLDIMRQSAYLFLTQSRFIAMEIIN